MRLLPYEFFPRVCTRTRKHKYIKTNIDLMHRPELNCYSKLLLQITKEMKKFRFAILERELTDFHGLCKAGEF